MFIWSVIPSLKEILDLRSFLEISYYFSPHTSSRTEVIVYFDHKIADSFSTFTMALMYGPILPHDLAYDLDAHRLFGLVNGLSTKEISHNTGWLLEFRSLIALYESIRLDDKKDFDSNITDNKLRFMPFIHGCEPVITPVIDQISYFDFITTTMYHSDDKKKIDGDNLVRKINRDIKYDRLSKLDIDTAKYKELHDEYTEEDTKISQLNDELQKLIDPNCRCISSFYKTREFGMQ